MKRNRKLRRNPAPGTTNDSKAESWNDHYEGIKWAIYQRYENKASRILIEVQAFEKTILQIVDNWTEFIEWLNDCGEKAWKEQGNTFEAYYFKCPVRFEFLDEDEANRAGGAGTFTNLLYAMWVAYADEVAEKALEHIHTRWLNWEAGNRWYTPTPSRSATPPATTWSFGPGEDPEENYNW